MNGLIKFKNKLIRNKRHAELDSASCRLWNTAKSFGTIFLFVLLLSSVNITYASTAPMPQPTQSSPVQPQAVTFENCNRFFKTDSTKLFYLTLAAVNANRFSIDEIQSKSGYILFTAAKKQFLASVIKIDAKNSMLKITPCDNTYFFPIGIVQNMFKYIELNINTPVEKLTVQ